MNSPVEQGVLALARKPADVDVSIDAIMRRKDFLGAINYMIDTSGLDDKEIYLSLQIDSGHWSNIRKGKQNCHFPTNKLETAMDLCANEIPLRWLARRRGYALVQIESETQRLLRESQEREAKLTEKLAYLETIVRGR
jgi:hypothetical protein